MTNYTFTNDWFSEDNGEPVVREFDKFLSCYKDKPCKFLEIGSYEGMSAIWMLDNVLTHQDSRLWCIDAWAEWTGDAFSTFVNNIKLRKAQNEFDNDVVLRVAGVFCFSIGSIYNSRGTEIFRQRHGSEHKSTAHFALERVYGVRVEHGGIFVNREDIGVNDERRRSGQRLVADFH